MAYNRSHWSCCSSSHCFKQEAETSTSFWNQPVKEKTATNKAFTVQFIIIRTQYIQKSNVFIKGSRKYSRFNFCNKSVLNCSKFCPRLCENMNCNTWVSFLEVMANNLRHYEFSCLTRVTSGKMWRCWMIQLKKYRH